MSNDTLQQLKTQKLFEVLPYIAGFTKEAGKASTTFIQYQEMKEKFEELDSQGIKVLLPSEVYNSYNDLKLQVKKACKMREEGQEMPKEFIEKTWEKRNSLSGAIVSYFQS